MLYMSTQIQVILRLRLSLGGTVTRIYIVPFLALGLILFDGASFSAAAPVNGLAIRNNTPQFAATAKMVGAVDPSTVMEVSIWLKPHNKGELDALAKDLYDKDSRNYQQWLTRPEFMQRFGPTEAEAETVREFFTTHGLKVTQTGPDNFFVRAQGTADQIDHAFHVVLNNYEVEGKTIRANANDPYVIGAAAALIGSVAGLDNSGYSHPLVSRNVSPNTSRVPTTLPQESRRSIDQTAASSPFNSVCFDGTSTQSFNSEGSFPDATYTGNFYTKQSATCGYTPKNIQAAYNLNPLYAEKYDGSGQTIVILDWCGSPTIRQDANAFSARFGLPLLTTSTFRIIDTPIPSPCEAPDPEINTDVEWAHAIAPGANIDLVVPPSSSFQDVDEAFYYAVDYQLGNVISGSYVSEESQNSQSVLTTEDLIAETAAVRGISANFASGDAGDYSQDFPQYYPPSVSAPADSPYATAVGGTSLALNPGNTIKWQSGWGTNENLLSLDGIYVDDNPNQQGYFKFGSGGGPSGVFAKPFYQKTLKGSRRMLPDISWLADPFTGAYIAISEPFSIPELTYQSYGGTSLACPMFSALWAIANQVAGKPLGQAAPYLYSLPSHAIMDIVPVGSASNVTGKVTQTNGAVDSYTANELAQPLAGTETYISAVWDYPLEEGTAYVVTFGTDTHLRTVPGWDDVTGVGVPNAKAFAEYFKP